MKTVTLDILDKKAFNLLKDLEDLNVIRLHESEQVPLQHLKSVKELKGRMTKQSRHDIDQQLNDLRNEWN
jgi:hypothetical protein